MESMYRNRAYANKFFLCEFLNLVNVGVQWLVQRAFLPRSVLAIHATLTFSSSWFRWLMDTFLGGAFRTYGREFLHYFEPEEAGAVKRDHADPSDLVFPKVRCATLTSHSELPRPKNSPHPPPPQVASCWFFRSGPNGRTERLDSICVLPLNILNEKIFYILWFWYIILIVVTVLAFFYRICTICFASLRRWDL